ncbi:uncharacterized protein N7459_010102 [Penicillium hispanicum]|uniref:uncharacterized protein n=1 Tax=Penicillium hispanicum TaxID=1080232 RepID=UPI002540CEDE|nr:uncharacterized protein N7459_010102 [Penicillium hispanicum]KAJ5566720.1 hypothetical protein N7459_010102 [Penicillium hispanicum]
MDDCIWTDLLDEDFISSLMEDDITTVSSHQQEEHMNIDVPQPMSSINSQGMIDDTAAADAVSSSLKALEVRVQELYRQLDLIQKSVDRTADSVETLQGILNDVLKRELDTIEKFKDLANHFVA